MLAVRKRGGVCKMELADQLARILNILVNSSRQGATEALEIPRLHAEVCVQ